MSRPVVTLTSDFGAGSPYVAAMKAVILRGCPDATLIDVTHEVPAFDINQASFLLWAGTRDYGPGSVHLAVVDPGVGTTRRGLALDVGGRFYVGPDNGLFSLVLEYAQISNGVALSRQPGASPTFEGRDIFAVAAARLAGGVPLATLGVSITDPTRLPPLPTSVLWVDNFGNLVTNLRAPIGGVRVGETLVTSTAQTYGEAEPGKPFWYVGSLGYVEVGVPGGRADRLLRARVGTLVEVIPRLSSPRD
ncbi:MAG TPA: SAM-dependent chlorinase/fluorinase [Candidatus Dormibacteraeota bacterium]|nr:SAM-dependent chlorinase/fluorinase [Candidatus Dormibacteraeota bacterium]